MSEKDPIPDNPNPNPIPSDINSNIIKEKSISKEEQEIENKPIEQISNNIEEVKNNKTQMETYHPHKLNKNKKIKDYIFEFLMLFIAITGGFFMENLREQHVEHRKEKQFIASMIKDIQEDTATMQSVMKNNLHQMKGVDTLLNILEKPYSKMNIGNFYYYTTNYINTYNAFTSRDITILQLKNSGGFRLIENKAVSDSIIIYYSTYDSYKEQVQYNLKNFQEIIKIEIEIIDFGIGRDPKRKPTISNPTRLKEFYNYSVLSYSALAYDNNWLIKYQKQAVSLLNFLKKEYNIE
jgi:hypothetical protein